MAEPKVTAKWKGKEYNPKLDMGGDLTFTYPDRAGGSVSRSLGYALTDEVLLEIKRAGYDITTLRISIQKLPPQGDDQK